MNTSPKWLIFRCYAPFLLLIFIGSIKWFFFLSTKSREDLNLLLAVWGGLASFFYFVQKQQLDELQRFKELFQEFNARYNALNEKPNAIAKDKPKKPLNGKEIETLYDYFNLCAEEYLYYKKGYIYPEVWTAWCNGIEFFLRDKRIEELWANENPASYYGLTPNEVRRHASGKY